MINNKTLQKFEQLISSGKTQAQAAEQLDCTVAGIRRAYERLNRTWPISQLTTELTQQRKRLRKLVESGLSQQQIAKELGISQSKLIQLLSKWRINEPKQSNSQFNKKDDLSKEVINSIVTHGGSLQQAIERTGADITDQTVRAYAERIGFDYGQYRNAYKQYGRWVIQPCTPAPIYTTDFLVKALCTGCNQIQWTSISNLRAGYSTSCKKCSKKSRQFRPVKDASSGKIYRSILGLAKAINKKDNYQQIRAQLIRHGCYVDPDTAIRYEFAESEDHSGS